MNEIIEYSLLSWPQFGIIALVASILLFLANRFHLFDRHTWNTSVGYHMFFCIVLLIVVIAFLAIKPVFHLMFLLVLFGFFYKNIFSYVRSIFNLYFSNIQMGDRIRVNDTEGKLTNINIGGMHITSDEEKAYFPFSSWKGEKIVLLSEDGNVPMFLEMNKTDFSNDYEAIQTLEKKIFEFPYLIHENVEIKDESDGINGKLTVSSTQYKESLISNLVEAGFSLKEKNT